MRVQIAEVLLASFYVVPGQKGLLVFYRRGWLFFFFFTVNPGALGVWKIVLIDAYNLIMLYSYAQNWFDPRFHG